MVFSVIIAGCGSSILGPDPPDDPESIFEEFWDSYDRYYAHFELKDIDWDEVYEEHRPRVGPETTDEELFEVLADMLDVLQDGHVYLVAPDRRAFSDRALRTRRSTFDAQVVQDNYLDEHNPESDDRRLVYGRVTDRVGYIRLSTLSGGQGRGDDVTGWIEEFDEAVDALMDKDGLILDLRNNGGGRATNSKFIASRFATERRPFLQTRSRSGPDHGDFSRPRRWYVEPRQSTFEAPLVVLTNRNTFSAAEWLTLALRQFDHTIHMGTQTGGGLAMFLPRQLPNGWMYTISVQDTRDARGRSYERIGVAPQLHLQNGTDDLDEGRDRMIEEAVEYLQLQ